MPSSAIRDHAYDAQTRRLAVEFVSGRRYVYFDVPPDEIDALRSSGSLGRYFNRRIRDRYRFRELERGKPS